eukprot:4254848-Pleurochrysis_carterae.AAC.1
MSSSPSDIHGVAAREPSLRWPDCASPLAVASSKASRAGSLSAACSDSVRLSAAISWPSSSQGNAPLLPSARILPRAARATARASRLCTLIDASSASSRLSTDISRPSCSQPDAIEARRVCLRSLILPLNL